MNQFSGQRREQPLWPCQATIVVSPLSSYPEGHGTGASPVNGVGMLKA